MKRIASWTTALVAVLFSCHSYSLAIGDIQLHSRLGQPLQATLPLKHAGDLDQGQIKISQATPEVYRQLGVEAPALPSPMRFTLSQDKQLTISTRAPIKEPFVNFVLLVSWPTGDAVREFRLLLDP